MPPKPRKRDFRTWRLKADTWPTSKKGPRREQRASGERASECTGGSTVEEGADVRAECGQLGRPTSGCDAVFIDDDPLEVRRVHHTCFTIQVAKGDSPWGIRTGWFVFLVKSGRQVVFRDKVRQKHRALLSETDTRKHTLTTRGDSA